MKDFLKGILFGILVIPLLDCVLSIIQQGSGHICTWIAAKTYDIKKNIEEPESEQSTFAIGFQPPSKKEEEEYYEEDDE